MLVYNGAFNGKKLGAQTYYTPFPAAQGQAQGLYQPYPPGWNAKTAPKIVLPPSPQAVQAYAAEANVPSSMSPMPAPAAAPGQQSVRASDVGSGISIAAAVVGGGALIASLFA